MFVRDTAYFKTMFQNDAVTLTDHEASSEIPSFETFC